MGASYLRTGARPVLQADIDTTSNSEGTVVAAPTDTYRQIMVTYIEYNNAGATDTVIHLAEGSGGTNRYKKLVASAGGFAVCNLTQSEWVLPANTALMYKQSVNSNQIYLHIGYLIV